MWHDRPHFQLPKISKKKKKLEEQEIKELEEKTLNDPLCSFTSSKTKEEQHPYGRWYELPVGHQRKLLQAKDVFYQQITNKLDLKEKNPEQF